MNSVCLIGRLAADPAGHDVGKDALRVVWFPLAVKRPGSEETDFPRVTCFGKTAEFVEEYFAKGDRIAITGHVQTGSYENKDGDTVYTTDIIGERAEFCESKKDDSGDRSQRSQRGGESKKDDSGDRSQRSKRGGRK